MVPYPRGGNVSVTVQEAKRLIRGRINACQSFSDERLLDTIHFAQEKAWNSGRWYGMMARLCVRVMEGRIVLPSEYGVMEAINYRGVPRMIHPVWYEFSPNGPGSPECWEHSGIFDLQTVPTVHRIIKGEKVFAVSKSKNQEYPGTVITVQGINSNNSIIYRYFRDDDCTEPVPKSDQGEQIEIGYIGSDGQPVPSYQTYNDFAWDGITNIFKPVTRGPIEIYAMGLRQARWLATMQPGETSSEYRSYRVPEGCQCGQYVEILAKKRKPIRPSQDHEVINIESESALINLALSVYHQFDSLDPEKSAMYLAAGLADLNGNLKENLGSQQLRPVVWTPASYARDNRRQTRAY